MTEQDIFAQALKQADPAQRSAWLDEVCEGRPDLRQRVNVLLKAHERAGGFLESPAAAPLATSDFSPITERPGTLIGPYKLLQQLGEGGMGTVWVAEQERPVKRRVALKVIKAGMDSAQVIARFEAERQALALMDHSNIAKVLDAGTTESGRPYFVMELVKGVPIVKYCDELNLPNRERLTLFVEVCQAVQHAHQKGIIHRDIKPSNILVAMQDGEPVPKVIDFGVAKALTQPLTERTMMTEFGAVIGTLEYMSPEQAELSPLDIDTRADIYGLGALLYELLTGSTPLDRQRLRSVAFDEMLRIIREDEPPKPSTRLTSSHDIQGLASHRRTEPRKLGAEVRGDLDWIVMKCLEKDRRRRYETANGLAGDIQRYLHDEPVEARPPSAMYRVAKFVRRNKRLVGSVITIFLLMAAGIAGTSYGLWGERNANQELAATNTKLQDVLNNLRYQLLERAFLQAVVGDVDGVADTTSQARVVTKTTSAQKDYENWFLTLKGIAQFHHGECRQAIATLQQAIEENPNNVSARGALSMAYVHVGDWQRGATLQERLATAKPRLEFEPYDALFLGYGRFYLDYTQSAEELEAVLRRQRWWFAPQAVLAMAWAHAASDRDDKHLVAKALNEVKIPQSFAEDNPFLQVCCLIVYDVAIELLGPDEDLVLQGTRLADSLEKNHPQYIVGALFRGMFFERINQRDRAEKAWRTILLSQDAGIFYSWPAAALYRDGHEAELLRLLPNNDFDADLCRAQVLAASPNQSQREQALEIYRKHVGEAKTWDRRALLIDVLLLLGKSDEARRQCNDWLDHASDDEVRLRFYFREWVELVAGKAPSSFAINSSDPTVRWWARYQTAFLDYAAGRRDQALAHFSSCAEHSNFLPFKTWADAFAKRLSADQSGHAD
jgi:serine/threonine protein kinase